MWLQNTAQQAFEEGLMAQPHERHSGSPNLTPITLERLRRYLPEDWVWETPRDPSEAQPTPSQLIEAFVHIAAARYTIATYLPRHLVHQSLIERLESPWVRWLDGTLLFADLSGSTALAERLSALGREGIEIVTDFLNHIFATMIHVVQEYGGDLVSFGGDALLVFFDDERHPRTATRAALALQAALHDYVRMVPGIGSFPMHLHIGVESGQVAFVSAGPPNALRYSVIGRGVNGVAMAEGLAGPGEVVVGPSSWSSLAAYAQGVEVAPGFRRIDDMQAALRPHEPLLDEPPITAAPQEAIPQLLDDLDHISPYIPAPLLNRILASPEQPQIEADLRPVTVLFAHTIGLEALAEQLANDQAAQAIQMYITHMQEAVEQFGGMLNKIDVAEEGIKLVAIFGAPVAYEDHTERAARAALEMQRRLETVNRQLAHLIGQTANPATSRNDWFTGLRQRIGLNLGTAFAGNVGDITRKEYTVMGDAVNVAARVMSTSAWDEIWCSDETMQAVAARMQGEARGHALLKGKAAPLSLFRLCGERDLSTTTLDKLEHPLIGRDKELVWMREHMRSALGGHGRVVRIVGDAGVGKTHLTAALLAEARAAGMQIISAACFSYTASIPYAAWAEWLKSFCGIASGDDDSTRTRKLTEQLADLGAAMEDWLPVLGDLVRLDVSDNWLTRGLDPHMRQTRRFELLEQLLFHATESRPVLALFEDMHWADPISLDLWQQVAGRLAHRPILLLGVHRPSLETALNDAAHMLELRELSDEESSAMLALLNGDGALSEAIQRQLIDRAAGNPLFLSELLHAVKDQHRPLADLPESLNGLLLSRIDQLDETSRGVLRVASVIGQRIPFGVLQSIQRTDQQALLRQLARLDAQEMTLLERSEPERVHTFRHALIQEVAYQSMLYARRRELHGRIGVYLEQRYANDLDDYYGLLAHHYRLSDRRDKAITYLLKAGHAAREVYANEEALQYYDWVLEALGDDKADPHAQETFDALGDVYATIGRYDEALAQFSAILHAPEITTETARRAYRKRGSVREKQGHYDEAFEDLDRAMMIARSGEPDISPLAIPITCADIALVHKRRGEYDQAIRVCEEGLRAVRHDPRTREDELIEARLHSELGGIYGMRGDYPRAQEHFERSLHARKTIDDLPGMIISHNNLGYLWQLQSEYDRALEHYRIAEGLARKINLRYALVFAANNEANTLRSMGAYTEAAARCLEALTLSQEMQDRHNIAQIYNTIGVIAYHQGNYEQAHEAYDKALQIHRELRSVHQEGSTLANLAVTLNAQGRFLEATTSAKLSLAHAEALHGQRLKVEALNALAEAALGMGDSESARAYAEEAVILSADIGSKYDNGIARRLRGQAASVGTPLWSADFETSITLFSEIKDYFELARTWASYAVALMGHDQKQAAQAYLKRAYDTFVAIGADGELKRLALLFERSI